MKKETKKEDSPWAAMDRLIERDRVEPGHGWFTAEQFAEQYGYSMSGAWTKLRQMALDGLVEKRKFRGSRGSQHGQPTHKNWWKVKG